MLTGLKALWLALLGTGWAAQVQTVKVAAPVGINAVLPSLAAPSASLQPNALTPQAALTGVLRGPGAGPVVQSRPAPAAASALA
ncbi:MAG: hypothetical protein PHU21_09680, partial [Elusimicrobia bacterium]|nr:hypothetical protein [Elusimicrobiota bacterium]